MATDRWGNYIRVAWFPHEVIWLRAALILDVSERVQAFHDIADMRGCSVETVRRKAVDIKRQMQAEAVQAAAAAYRPAPIPMGQSWLSKPTKQQLMAGR